MNQNRGRPRGHQSYSTMSVLSSVAQIAAKHNVDSGLLLDAFAEAWAHDKSQCEKLEIECRKANQASSIILIICNDRVVWQFPVEAEILKKPKAFKSYIPIVSNPAQTREHDSTQKHICELRAKMRGITVTGEVREVPPRKLVYTKYGFEAYVSNILLADKTGTIRLSLWNNQIDSVTVGDTLNIENASTSMFQGQLQLRLGKSGTMSIDTSARELTAV